MLLHLKMLAFQVVKAIAEYAFVNNPWPLILSFENHCNTEQVSCSHCQGLTYSQAERE